MPTINPVCYKPPMSATLIRGHPLARGLVGFWPLNEGRGESCYDRSVYRNRMVWTSASVPAMAWTLGTMGRGVECADSPNSFLTMSTDVPIFDFPGDFSVLIWLSTTDSGALVGFINKHDGTNGIRVIQTTNIRFVVNGGYISSSQAVNDGLVHMIACVRRGAVGYIYRDGSLIFSGAVDSGTTAGSGIFYLGRGSSTSYVLDGIIYHAAAYNRALGAAEVQQLWRDPWSVLRPKPMDLFVGATSGGTINVTVTPGTLAAVLTLQSPTLTYDYVVTPAALSLLLTEPSPEIHYDFVESVSSLGLVAAQPAPAVNYDFTTTPEALDLALALQGPTYAYDFKFSASAFALLLSQQTPELAYDFKLALESALSLVLEQQTPDVSTAVNITVTPDAQGLVLSIQTASVNYDFTFSASTLSLLAAIPSPELSYDYKVALGSALALAVSLHDPTVEAIINVTVSPSAQGLSLALQTPTVNYDYTVSPSALGLAVEVQTPTLTYDMLVAIASSLGMTLTLEDPTVSILVAGRTYIVCSSTDPAQLDVYIGGTLVARFT